MNRYLSGISRDEWITWKWVDITSFGDEEPKFAQGRLRTPDEGAEAASQWDIWYPSAKRVLNGE